MLRMDKQPHLRITMSRGQLFALDAIVASLIAIALIAVVLSLYSDIYLEEAHSFRYVDLSMQAQNAANILLYSQASPSNWSRGNLSNAIVPSITTSSCVVDWQMAAALASSDYTALREALGVTDNIHIRLLAFNSSQTYMEIGQSPPLNATLYRIERPVLLNGSISRIHIVVWR